MALRGWLLLVMKQNKLGDCSDQIDSVIGETAFRLDTVMGLTALHFAGLQRNRTRHSLHRLAQPKTRITMGLQFLIIFTRVPEVAFKALTLATIFYPFPAKGSVVSFATLFG